MMENEEHTFRTKTGTCTITPDRIILAREGARGTAARIFLGSSIGRLLLIYGFLGGGFLVLGIVLFIIGSEFLAPFFILFGAYFLWTAFFSRYNSTAPVIERSAIRSVQAHPPRPPATRGYYTVFFEENGQECKRVIMLPGSTDNGREEYERSEEVMRAAGLLDNG